MPVNIGKLELEIAKKIGCSTTSDPADLQLLANSIKQLKNSPIDYVSTYANLPTPSASNKGDVYFVDSECTVYWSTGCYNKPLKESTGTTELWIWGLGTSGQLGDGTATTKSSPVTTAAGGLTWCQVSAGCLFTSAIKTDGTLWTWGLGTCGRLGDNNITSKSSPVITAGGGTNWCQVSSSNAFSIAIKTDGTLWTWGWNTSGVLGDGSFFNRSSPGTTLGGGTTWCQTSAGVCHAIAIKTDGTLWAWGNGGYGRLGTGNTTNQSSPVTTAGGGTTWCQVSADEVVMAVKTDGTLWGWGYNFCGRLGTGNTTNQSSPVTTAGGGTTWKQVSVGNQNISAIKTDGTLWTWGNNLCGGLGTGDTTNRSSPATTIGGGTTWCQAGSSLYSITGLKTDGTLWVWGYNNVGQLGVGDNVNRLSPVTNLGVWSNWFSIGESKHCHIAAIRKFIY